MLLRLVSPVLRSGSSIPQFVKRLPADIAARLIGVRVMVTLGDETFPFVIPKSGIRLSLRSSDPGEAKARQAELAAFFEKVFRWYRDNRPVALTRRNAVALSKAIYEGWANGEGRERTVAMEQELGEDGKPTGRMIRTYEEGAEEQEGFRSLAAKLEALAGQDAVAVEPILGPLVSRLLLEVGVPVLTPASRAVVLEAFRAALLQAATLRARNAEGDYSPDPHAKRFPEWAAPHEEGSKSPGPSAALSLDALVDGWWLEAKARGLSANTLTNYRGVFRKFAAFLGHDDARRVSPEDVLAFKDHRLSEPQGAHGKPVSARTVKDHDLAALKSVFGWAVANRRLPSNPAEGVTIKRPRVKRSRSKDMQPQEAKALLLAARNVERGEEASKVHAAKRWVPWLLCYTGARVGEMVQLRKRDVVRRGSHWVIIIDPEAGAVKGGSYREVPVHPALVDEGFITFVERSRSGHLFVTPNAKTGDVLGPLQGVVNRVREFSREHVSDTRIAPNHAWRHRFETLGRSVGMREDLQNMMLGHAGKTVAAREYGEPAGLYREMRKLPRVTL